MQNPCLTNENLSYYIIDRLIKLGVSDFCIGSGSRSAPFAHALSKTPAANTFVCYEERSLGFYALGIAKASNQLVVIITTTGSAIANVFPAVMEAYKSSTPLIVISSDRPFEDRARGLNQTCDMDNFFSTYCTYHLNISSPPHNFSIKSISSYMSYGVNMAKEKSLPIHFNVSFQEPLLNQSEKELSKASSCPQYLPLENNLAKQSFDYLCDLFASIEKGVIIACEVKNKEESIEILRFAEKMQYPILADPLSGLRELGKSSISITHYNQIIHHRGKLQDLNPDIVIFFGGTLVSKNILQWTRSLKDTKQIMVNNSHHHMDPTLSIDTVIKMDPVSFCSELKKGLKRKSTTAFFSLWKQFSLAVEDGIEEFFEDKETLYEPIAISSLLSICSKNLCSIFFGNSLSIRYGDNFFFPKEPTCKIYGNRGVSGIDGNISTALGICKKTNNPLLCLIGDQTFLYDVNALHIMAKEKIPLILIVINNDCGAIFDFLPYSSNRDLVENFVAPNNPVDIGKIAISYGVTFWRTSDVSDYKKMVEHLLLEGSGGIIEVVSDRKKNTSFHQALQKSLTKKIKKSLQKDRTSFFSIPHKTKKESSYAFTDF